ncbi:hypothetical protein SmJEL517_g00222 [Synchytrium microbalum]|uniref:F-box domain-containing protein n=1 Tax=Synchytrium microbalum TaxID=1806994 RepID=A0A507CJ34_9FUNG|nr:uncharacterized protein SmJEL517_g00222 [Synchytrium microbalum]TPX38194.1 hypothetical protein SmJEL517_g00222 [Synchytrium microbalum]
MSNTVDQHPLTYCYRHAPGKERLVDKQKAELLAEQVALLSKQDHDAVRAIWSAFTAASATLRPLILDGILLASCLPQLSHISTELHTLLRMDFIADMPTETSVRILQYLDATSLCHAAQVSRKWKQIADDDAVWHRLCVQHIDRKCAKCGWGLPLMDAKKRKIDSPEPVATEPRIAPASSSNGTTSNGTSSNSIPKRKTLSDDDNLDIVKRQKTDSGCISSSSKSPELLEADIITTALEQRVTVPERPWKDIYAERLVVERNWRRGTFQQRVLLGHTDGVMCLHYDEASALLVTGGYDRTIRVWNVDTGCIIKILQGHEQSVRAVYFDDAKLFSASMDRTIKLWNWKTGECIRTLEGHTGGVLCLHVDDKMLVSGSDDGYVRVWSTAHNKAFGWKAHSEWVNRVQIYNKKQLFTCSDDTTVKLWDIDTKQLLRTFTGHVGQVYGMVAALPHGHDLVRLPPGYGYTLLATDGVHYSDGTKSLSANQAGKLVTASLDNTIKIWNVGTGECVLTCFGHTEGVWCVTFDSLRMASGSHDGTVKVWDFESGQVLHTLNRHRSPVNCIALSDTKIISGDDDGTIVIWDFLPANAAVDSSKLNL